MLPAKKTLKQALQQRVKDLQKKWAEELEESVRARLVAAVEQTTVDLPVAGRGSSELHKEASEHWRAMQQQELSQKEKDLVHKKIYLGLEEADYAKRAEERRRAFAAFQKMAEEEHKRMLVELEMKVEIEYQEGLASLAERSAAISREYKEFYAKKRAFLEGVDSYGKKQKRRDQEEDEDEEEA